MKRILVIDDCPMSLTMASRLLGRNGFAITECEASTTALMLILNETFDAIVTDIEMPALSGWDLIRIIRSWTKTALVPVIFLTKLDSERDKIRGFSLGADDYLTKPVQEEELVGRVRQVLEESALYLRHVRRKLAGNQPFTETVSMFGIPSFLSLLEEQGKTGMIYLEHNRERAQLAVVGGRIYSATMAGEAESVGAACVARVLGWAAAFYRFVPGAVTSANLINQSTTQLLLAEANANAVGAATVRLVPSASGKRVAIARMLRRRHTTRMHPRRIASQPGRMA